MANRWSLRRFVVCSPASGRLKVSLTEAKGFIQYNIVQFWMCVTIARDCCFLWWTTVFFRSSPDSLISVSGSTVWCLNGTTVKKIPCDLSGWLNARFKITRLVHLSVRAGLLPTPVHGADSPVSSGQPQHRPPRQTLRGVWRSEQRGVEQIPERLQGRWQRGALRHSCALTAAGQRSSSDQIAESSQSRRW